MGKYERSVRRSRDRRAKRFAYVLALSVLVAGGAGMFLGFMSHQSRDEVRAEQATATTPSTGELGDLTTEVNRTLLELWRMEDVEYQRNSR